MIASGGRVAGRACTSRLPQGLDLSTQPAQAGHPPTQRRPTTASNGTAGKTLVLRVGVPLSTGTSDVAGMPRKCVRGGTRPLRTRPQPTHASDSGVVRGFGTCGGLSIWRASAMNLAARRRHPGHPSAHYQPGRSQLRRKRRRTKVIPRFPDESYAQARWRWGLGWRWRVPCQNSMQVLDQVFFSAG
jgi:hypothetical protein